ncbi:ankyrin repeat domain-containing protein [Aspergillus lucknowensis]|uniref:Ankyrin repeat-containing domain protein n=1 Tax=Aspergillus lucknowensis TaxID=176173 RepID=A0ABR4LS96_9EURO
MIQRLPLELLHDILGLVAPSWRWGTQCDPGFPATRTAIVWFMGLRRVSRTFDETIIRHLLAAVRRKTPVIDRAVDIRLARGPPTLSALAIMRRIVGMLVNDAARGREDESESGRRRRSSRYALVNTIVRASDGAVALFCSGRYAEEVRRAYTDGMISVLVGILRPGLILRILNTGEDLDDLDEETGEWRSAALMAAAYLGRVEDLKRLLGLGLAHDINADPQDKWIYPPLMAAALGGRGEVVQFLVENGAHLHARLRNGENAVHFATLYGHSGLVSFLLSRGVDADARNNDGDTPLLWAAGVGHAEITRLLLPHADVNVKDGLLREPLHWAAERGHGPVVRELLKSPRISMDTFVAATDIETTPLAVAARTGREDIFQMLFTHPTMPRELHPIILERGALEGRKVGILKTIVKACPNILAAYTSTYSETALIRAVAHGAEEVVRYLLSREDIDINFQDRRNFTALHEAARDRAVIPNSEPILPEKSTEGLGILQALLDHPGIDVNPQNWLMRTPLELAFEHQHSLEAARMILAHKDVDLRPSKSSGNTPLHHVVVNGRRDAVDMLLEMPGLDVWHKNLYDETALSLAAQLGHHSIIDALLDPELGVTEDTVRHAMVAAEEHFAKTHGKEETLRLLSDWIARNVKDTGAGGSKTGGC